MKKIMIIAAIVALGSMERSVQANLVPLGMGSWEGSATFVGTTGNQTVNYFVDYNSNTKLYTYAYDFNIPEKVLQLEINADNVNSVVGLPTGNTTIATLATADGVGYNFNSANTTYSSATIDNLDSYLVWSLFDPSGSTYAYAFTSLLPPTWGSGSINDKTQGPWGDNGVGTAIPVPVPEASTMLAGAMLLLPFGMSTLRVLRKSRTA